MFLDKIFLILNGNYGGRKNKATKRAEKRGARRKAINLTLKEQKVSEK